jgi:hypothetical protein
MPLLSSLSVGSLKSYGFFDKSKPSFLTGVSIIFLGSQNYVIPAGVTSVDYLIVGGGGGGGGIGSFGGFGAGGGAGGYRIGSGYGVSSGSTYTITIGAGGGRFLWGSNSGIYNASASIWSSGGGGGGCASLLGSTPGRTFFGKNGGSGGGATKKDTSNEIGGIGLGNYGIGAGAAFTGIQQGYGGGTAFTGGHPSPGAGASGGGGGASANGSNASSGVSGRGGAGLASSIAGYPIAFAGGGGGYTETAPNVGNGGAGGGGNSNGPGTANSGGGGGGGGPTNINGGSGIVILKYYEYKGINSNTVIQQFANGSSYVMPDGSYWTNATMTSGLYGRRYSGYFSDNVNFFNTAAFSGTSKVYTNINSNWTEGGDNFSIEWLGYFKPNITGLWNFETISDDASYLWIGDFAVGGYTTENATINNGGAHAEVSRSASVSLVSGVYYPIRIQFGEAGGGERMTVNFTPPGGVSTNDGTGYYFNNSINSGI